MLGDSADSSTDPTSSDPNNKPSSILCQWIGTSTFFITEGIDLQRRGHLMSLVHYREHIVHQMAAKPYDPTVYIELSNLDHKLGFCDIGAANAYRALNLIKAGLGIDKNTSPTALSASVRDRISQQLVQTGKPPSRVAPELRKLYRNALRELLHNLLGSASIWDGLVQGQEALKLFPRDEDLTGTMGSLKETFKISCETIQKLKGKIESIEDTREAVAYARRGRIYQKPYPWLDGRLYTRTSTLVKEVNKDLEGSSYEIRRVVFGEKPSEIVSEEEDVGPLGIFATRDIPKGELLMVDETFGTCVSDTPSSFLTHCDACNATLAKPYTHPDEIIKPDCCGKVAYCSTACHERASNGYHHILCGKDIEWLYKDVCGIYSKRGARDHFLSILFLRVMSIVVSDREAQQASGKKPTHPLLHPLLARMTANYSGSDYIHPEHPSSWLYSENVVAAHRILQLLGVDVFAEPDFAPEVIQTVFWRLENNTSRCVINLSSPGYPEEPIWGLAKSDQDDEHHEHMLCLNSQYLFLNHSCEPNVDWHCSNSNPRVGISWLTGFNGKILKPGCGGVWCIAAKDVKEGEELKISYVGTPLGRDREDRRVKRNMLNKWFDRGCGCAVCEHENETGVLDEESEDGSEDGSGDDARSKAGSEAWSEASWSP